MILVSPQYNITGISSPGSSTDRALATWNGTSGANLRSNSTVKIDSSNNLALTAHLVSDETHHIGNNGSTSPNASGVRPSRMWIKDAVIVGDMGGTSGTAPYALNNGLVTGMIGAGNGDGAGGTANPVIGCTNVFNSTYQGFIGFHKDASFINFPCFRSNMSQSDLDVYFSVLHIVAAREDLLKFGSDGSFTFLKAGSEQYRIVPSSQVNTTDATETTLQTITTTTDTCFLLEARVIGRRTGGASGSAGDCAQYILQAVIKNIGGTVTVNSLQTTYAFEDQAAWAATLDISSTSVRIRVTGAADNNISWSSTCIKQRI